MFREKIAKLFEVKSIMSLVVTAVFAYLAVMQLMERETTSMVIGMVFGSFFQYQATKATKPQDGGEK